MRQTLLISLAVHVLVVCAGRLPVRAAVAADVTTREVPDRWAGTTAEIPIEGVGDDRGAAAAPAAPESPASPAPPVQAAPANPAPKPVAPAEHAKEKAPADHPKPKRAPKTHPPAAADGGEAGGDERPGPPGAASGGTYGAEGEGSTRDLGRAFTRAIPAACSADPIWAKIPTGSAGQIDISIEIDATGHITDAKPVTVGPPEHLANLLRRTLALLQSGTFALRGGAVSEGTAVLRVRATVSDVAVPEGQVGGAFGLSQRFDRGKGEASFTQTNGRHVELVIQMVRQDPRTPPG